MRVWRLRGCPPHACQRFQLTHPWGCDEYHIPRTRDNYISTHTPVRVWHKPHLYITVFDISTHTPVRVWPDILQTCNGEDGHFNSHTREGVTLWKKSVLVMPQISTHTPVRVWLYAHMQEKPRERFQLTHPWGCDMMNCVVAMILMKFQLTHPWGCDCTLYCSAAENRNFNSHTREGVTNFGFHCC